MADETKRIERKIYDTVAEATSALAGKPGSRVRVRETGWWYTNVDGSVVPEKEYQDQIDTLSTSVGTLNSEMVITNYNLGVVTSDLSALEATVSSIPSGPQGIQGIPGISGSPYQIGGNVAPFNNKYAIAHPSDNVPNSLIFQTFNDWDVVGGFPSDDLLRSKLLLDPSQAVGRVYYRYTYGTPCLITLHTSVSDAATGTAPWATATVSAGANPVVLNSDSTTTVGFYESVAVNYGVSLFWGRTYPSAVAAYYIPFSALQPSTKIEITVRGKLNSGDADSITLSLVGVNYGYLFNTTTLPLINGQGGNVEFKIIVEFTGFDGFTLAGRSWCEVKAGVGTDTPFDTFTIADPYEFSIGTEDATDELFSLTATANDSGGTNMTFGLYSSTANYISTPQMI